MKLLYRYIIAVVLLLFALFLMYYNYAGWAILFFSNAVIVAVWDNNEDDYDF